MVTWSHFTKAKIVFHDSWNDPEIFYKGPFINYYKVEDELVDLFKEDVNNKMYDSSSDENFYIGCVNNADFIEELLDVSV